MAPIWIGGLGALVGGLGAASAAAAAWRAAVSSSHAAIEAREAMALAVRPSVEVWTAQWGGPESPASARVWVQGAVSDWPATDVLLQFGLASGKRGSTSTKLLEPLYAGSPQNPPFLHIDIEQPSDTWPPPGGDHLEIMVLFSDMRHAASYRITASADIRRYAEGGTALAVVITEPSTIERLAAPAEKPVRRRKRRAVVGALGETPGHDASTR